MTDVDKDYLKTLLSQYEEKEGILSEKKREVEEALSERSKVVALIASTIAPAKRFNYKGAVVTIVVRGDTFFFRGLGKEGEMVKID